ncbi:MAG: metallophosphoesterase [Acidobacteriota bacterium]
MITTKRARETAGYSMPGRRTRYLFIAILLAGLAGGGLYRWLLGDERYVYLTFDSEDTSTSMVVHPHARATARQAILYYDTTPRHGALDRYEHSRLGRFQEVAGVDRRFFFFSLEGLHPATRYFFTAWDDRDGPTEEFSFRTLPDDDRPLRIVDGGDIGWRPLSASAMARVVANQDPDVILLGGDLAYAQGSADRWWRWRFWFSTWRKMIRGSDGRLIPAIAAIGNHEVKSADPSLRAQDRAPFYFALFHQNEDSRDYFVRRLGSNVALFCLDSGHVYSHEEQAGWLRSALEDHEQVPFKVALYHVPLYPSHRVFEGPLSVAGRTFWQPLFEQFGVRLSLEHHDHAQKRTYPIRGGRIDPVEGIVYVGDGAWGRGPRTVEADRWYLAHAAARRHIWRIDVTSREMHLTALDEDGAVFDDVTIVGAEGGRGSERSRPSESGDRVRRVRQATAGIDVDGP